MPIDPSIPLHVQPVQTPDLIRSYGNALTIRSQVQQQELQRQQAQIHNQQMQENTLKLDKLKQDRTDDDTLRGLMLEHNGDLEAVLKHGAGKISPDKYRTLTQLDLEDKTKRASLSKEQNQLEITRGQQLAGYIQGVLDTPADKRAPIWSNAKAEAVAKKLITPERAAELGDDVPDDNGLLAMRAGLLGGVTASQRALSQPATDRNNLELAARTVPDDPSAYAAWYAGLDDRTKRHIPASFSAQAVARVRKLGMTPKDALEAPGTQVDVETKLRGAVAAKLGAATTKDEYMRAWAKEEPDAVKGFPHPDEFDPKTTPDKVRQLGMTAQQQATSTQAAARDLRLTEHEKHVEAQQKINTELRRETLNLRKGDAAKSRGVDFRQADRDFSRAAESEDGIHTLRLQLGRAIARAKSAVKADGTLDSDKVEGLSYVDKNGRTIRMAAATKDTEEPIQALVEDMEARYRGISGKLKRVMTEKYDAVGRMGGNPSVSLEAALAAIDDGDQKLFAPAGKAAAAQVDTAQPGAGKTGAAPPVAAPAATPKQEPAAQPKPKQPAAQAAPAVGARFQRGNQVVRWDGTNWIDEATGKPAKF